MFARTPPLERAVLALQHLPVADPGAREHAQTVRTALTEAIRTGSAGELIRLLRLLDGLGVDAAAVDAASSAVHSANDALTRRRAEARLRAALEPSRARVLAHIAAEPDGLRGLIDLRAALLQMLERGEAAELAALDDDLRAFLSERFDPGVLELRRLTWRDSAALLERLAQAEAVHAVRGWFDLKDRLDDDRRVYAFFHPALPDVPLAFIEVALTDEFPSSIRAILNRDAPPADAASARTAVFYSISNCEPGLAAIPFGNALIKRVVDRLRRELPRVRTFATLSPLPGFRAWVNELGETLPEELRQALATPGWHRSEALAARVREPLSQLAARYVLEVKRHDGAPRDAVARFHIANGALVDRILFLGDPSERGLKGAYATMVSYRYALDRIAENQVAHALDRRVDASGTVAALAAAAPGAAEAPRRPSRWAAATAAVRRAAARALPHRAPASSA